MAESMHEKMMRLHSAGDKNSGGQPKLLAYEIALKSKKQIADGTYAFTFTKPQGFHFTAGQHIRMTLINPPQTDDEGDSRFWSLVSTPQDNDLVIAMRMRDSAFKRVLGSMPIGTKVRIQTRQHVHAGAFILHDDASLPAVFMVGGIGIVPAYSMIKDALERNLPHKLVLFYSNRRPEDAPYLAELQKLANQHSSFTFVPTMTEPEKSARTWQGESGRINQALLERFVPDLSSPIYYISGLPQMVSAMKTMLKQAGVDDKDIRAEEFAGFTMNHGSDAVKTSNSRKTLIAIGLIIAVMIIVHATAGFSIFKASQGSSLLNNPIVYLVGGFTLGTVFVFKFRIITGLKHGKK